MGRTRSNDALQELIAEAIVMMNYLTLVLPECDTTPLTKSTVRGKCEI